MRIKSETEFWAGVMFLLVGASFAAGSLFYNFGTSARPGPGYFPFGLGLLLTLLGGLEMAKAVFGREQPGSKFEPIVWKPLLTIVGSVLAFGVALPLLGLMLALPLLICVSSLASDEFRWKEALLNSVVLTAGSWAVFNWALNLVIPLWPAFIR